jgi:drug/metabolite transporter (DMT)-like permease
VCYKEEVHRRSAGILWIASGAVLWGTDPVFRRPLAGPLGPTQIVFYEHLVLLAIVLPVIFRAADFLRKLSSRSWMALIGTAWLGSAIATILFTAAIRAGNPTTAVLLQKTQPFFAIALARIVLRERWQASFPYLAAAGIAGAYLVAFGNGNLLTPAYSVERWPAMLALGAAAGWGFATVFGRIAIAELPFELVTALRIAFALPLLLIAAVVQSQTALPSLSQTGSLIWLALIPGFAALMLYYRGLRDSPASKATIAELAFPVTASLLNWYVLGVDVAPLQIAGFAVVWAAIFRLSNSGSG